MIRSFTLALILFLVAVGYYVTMPYTILPSHFHPPTYPPIHLKPVGECVHVPVGYITTPTYYITSTGQISTFTVPTCSETQ